ncbi:MAG: bifunctional adenosylcobinamide kinase/adenosylcobinamide-phosphate guanylyltransferase [Pseudomonadota bacterium]
MQAHALILGGARSGKTRLGLARTEALSARRLYIATAEAWDDEMAARIARHTAERGDGWATLEEPLALAEALASDAARGADAVLVDCLTLWLSNLMHHEKDVEAETEALIEALRACPRPVSLVSNEVGLGLVPETPLGRAFRDEQGRLNQRLAAALPQVAFVAAGLPLALKGPPLA